MIDFFKENIVFDICLILALLAWGITIGAQISSKLTGHYVSGIPGVGGILLGIGFLLSEYKLLAVLGLLDPDIIYLLFIVIPNEFIALQKVKKFVPPSEMEGGEVIEYTKYKKCYEEIRTSLEEYGGGYRTNLINRYVIIKKDYKYNLLKIVGTDETIETHKFDTLEECENAVDKKIEWIKK